MLLSGFLLVGLGCRLLRLDETDVEREDEGKDELSLVRDSSLSFASLSPLSLSLSLPLSLLLESISG